MCQFLWQYYVEDSHKSIYVIVNDLLMLVLPGIFRASDELGTGDKFNCFFLGNKFNVVYLHLFFYFREEAETAPGYT